jgi:hypothetical protein
MLVASFRSGRRAATVGPVPELGEGQEPGLRAAMTAGGSWSDATLAALEHTVGWDEHLPYLRQLVASRAGAR